MLWQNKQKKQLHKKRRRKHAYVLGGGVSNCTCKCLGENWGINTLLQKVTSTQNEHQHEFSQHSKMFHVVFQMNKVKKIQIFRNIRPNFVGMNPVINFLSSWLYYFF